MSALRVTENNPSNTKICELLSTVQEQNSAWLTTKCDSSDSITTSRQVPHPGTSDIFLTLKQSPTSAGKYERSSMLIEKFLQDLMSFPHTTSFRTQRKGRFSEREIFSSHHKINRLISRPDLSGECSTLSYPGILGRNFNALGQGVKYHIKVDKGRCNHHICSTERNVRQALMHANARVAFACCWLELNGCRCSE